LTHLLDSIIGLLGLRLRDDGDERGKLLTDLLEHVGDKLGCNFIFAFLDLVQLIIGFFLLFVPLEFAFGCLDNSIVFADLEALGSFTILAGKVRKLFAYF
jgi:hypothetical protein